MRRYLLFLCFLSLGLHLRADALSNRLRLILPGDDAPTVNERQFLYQRINRLWLALEADKTGRKSVKKRVKRINEKLRKSYLRTRAADARLADAFRNGRFNDATAALLTALTYERFEVDYVGKVDHYLAYLIADPDGRNTPVYAPDPPRLTNERRAAFRRDYAELLRATVLEDVGELSAAQADELFAAYYYRPAKRLTLGQLTAFQFYRRAQTAYRAKDYPEAIRLLEAALNKEERPAFLVLLNAAEAQLKAIVRPEVEGDVPLLFAQWAELPDNRYLPAALLQHFDEKQRLLLARGETGAAAELLAAYLDRAPAGQTAWQAELRNLQAYRLLNHYFLAGRIDLAKQIAERLYAERPTDERLRYVLGEILIDGLRRTRLTGPAFTAAVEATARQYPFVRQQERFADLYLRELAWNVRDRYEADDGAGGQAALERFTDALVGISVNEARSVWTLTAFIAASNYHFRLEDYSKARFYVDKGLAYNPADAYLLHRRALLAKY